MSDFSDEKLQDAIAAAIDHATTRYANDRSSVFASSSDHASAYFGGMNEALRAWGRTKECMVPNCKERSIAKSHAVSKQMSLATIAEERHVLEPQLDKRSGALGLVQVGVGDASTFPGFCSKHEQLFVGFENSKEMTSPEHYGLQVYRSACRELFRTRWKVEYDTQMVDTFVKRRDEGIQRMILEHLANAGHTNVSNLSLWSIEDPAVDHAREMIGHVQGVAKKFESELLPALEKGVFSGDFSDCRIVSVHIDVELPVALCGSGGFYVEPQNPHLVTALLSVIPQPKSTLIFMCAEAAQETYLQEYLKYWSTHSIKLLSMIESWMIFGTDQWYLRPSIWNTLPTSRQESILRLIWNPRRNIAEECPLSVFDALRKEILSRAERRADAGSPEFLAFFQPEYAKLNPGAQPEDTMDLGELLGF
ncbi:hypothetical protein ACX94F_01240 [Stenotrophomonas hibiscicola]